MFDTRILKRSVLIGTPAVLVLLLSIALFSGFAWDITRGLGARALGSATIGDSNYDGLVSLGETIVTADVIALVSLREVEQGIDIWKPDTEAETLVYSKTLEFTFDVQEYLKGTGKDQITGIVVDTLYEFDTRLGAELVGRKIDPDRNEHWDDRDAVVFLWDDSKDPRIDRESGRYLLGYMDWGAEYNIDNIHYRPWLPESLNSSPNDRRFLLESDIDNPSAETVSYDELKRMVSSISQELEGRSDEYRECLRYHFNWQRVAGYIKESLDGEYHYKRSDEEVGSGQPKGAPVHTNWMTYYQLEFAGDPEYAGKRDKYLLVGRDAQYFTAKWPGYVSLARPLPAGEYRMYHAFLPNVLHICGGTIPEYEMGRQELFVNVTAPAGTVHEAFFDLAQDGKGVVAAGDTVGVLEPATFSDANGASVTIQRIAWEAEAGGVGTVKLTLSPHNSIAGHTVGFIALDGSVPLSLSVAEAQADATTGTLTWKVQSQPWQSGDKLMLRVSASAK